MARRTTRRERDRPQAPVAPRSAAAPSRADIQAAQRRAVRLADLRREPIGRVKRSALAGQMVRDPERKRGKEDRKPGVRDRLPTQAIETRLDDPNCKGRPASNKSKGGKSRPFVKWCSKKG